MSDDRLIDAPAVAELLCVPVSWVRQETRAGRMPVVPLGRYRRYRRSAVVAWVEGLESNGRAAQQRKHNPRVRPT
jgi:excisionase family DNA binding protein